MEKTSLCGLEDLILRWWYSPKWSTKSLSKPQVSFLKNKNRQVHPKICIEMQGTQNSQNNLEKNEWSWITHTFLFQNLLQNYSNQDSVVLLQNRTRSPEINPYISGQLISTSMQRPSNRERIVFSTNDAGINEYSHTTEWN